MTAGTRGEAFIMARYDQITVGTQVLVIPEIPDFKFPNEPEANYIDTLVHNKLRRFESPRVKCVMTTLLFAEHISILSACSHPRQ